MRPSWSGHHYELVLSQAGGGSPDCDDDAGAFDRATYRRAPEEELLNQDLCFTLDSPAELSLSLVAPTGASSSEVTASVHPAVAIPLESSRLHSLVAKGSRDAQSSSVELEAGSYVVRVVPDWDDHRYELTLSATPAP